MSEPVVVRNPLAEPYQTGSYLVYDSSGQDNFRSAASLADHPYRASGSHQLDLKEFITVLGEKVVKPHRPETLHLVDLRQESHGFFDGKAVSWYADNDFSNVGLHSHFINAMEAAMLSAHCNEIARIYTLVDDADDDLQQERVLPTSVARVPVDIAYNEGRAASMMGTVLGLPVQYTRIHVTDHCAPSSEALREFVGMARMAGPNDWIHFHCHGGDGRTTTFLALYDMLCWEKSGDALPSLEQFSERQCQLSSYCLDPTGCSCGPATAGWKLSLALQRWSTLSRFHQKLT